MTSSVIDHLRFLVEHDPFRKPDSTPHQVRGRLFRDHALARQEMQMITALTTFTLPKPITREEARSIFLSTAPKYQGVQGLFRKTYVLSQDGVTVGGVYLWN